jgi:hypothetical protein
VREYVFKDYLYMRKIKCTILLVFIFLVFTFFTYFGYRFYIFSNNNDIMNIYQYRKTVGVGFDYPIKSQTGFLVIKKYFGYKYVIIDGNQNKKYIINNTSDAIKRLIIISKMHNINKIPIYSFCTINNNEYHINEIKKRVSSEISSFDFEYNDQEYVLCTCGSDKMKKFHNEDYVDFLILRFIY